MENGIRSFRMLHRFFLHWVPIMSCLQHLPASMTAKIKNFVALIFPPITLKAKWFVVLYGVLELLLGISGAQSGVAHFAHLGGMIWGFLLLWWWRRKGKIYF